MESKIPGVSIFEINKFEDERGWLMELYRNDLLFREHWPAMAYVSQTLPGVARGPHEHVSQTDLFGFFGPGTFKVCLWQKEPLLEEKFYAGEDNPLVVIVPPGVVHAYQNVSEVPGLVFNAPNQLYGGPGKKYPIDEVRHEDDPASPFQIS